MGIEELKQDLQVWIKSNRNFYYKYVRAIRKDNFTEKGKVPLAAYMHIYDFAMSQIPNLPESVKFGSYGNLFENYYGKYGFSKLLGMLAQVLNKDMFLYLQAQKNTQKLKDAILYWVLLDDFHFFLMCKIGKCENILEEKLRELELQIIQNSMVLEIKDKAYWLSPHIYRKLLFEDEERENLQQIWNNHKEQQEACLESPNLQNDEDCDEEDVNKDYNECESSEEKCNDEKAVQEMPKIAKKKGRRPSLSSESLKDYISLIVQDEEKANAIFQFVENELKMTVDGPGLACLAVAMESCKVIARLDGGMVAPFHALLKKENPETCDSSNFSKQHRLLCCYFETPNKLEETKKVKIDKYVEKLQEILK